MPAAKIVPVVSTPFVVYRYPVQSIVGAAWELGAQFVLAHQLKAEPSPFREVKSTGQSARHTTRRGLPLVIFVSRKSQPNAVLGTSTEKYCHSPGNCPFNTTLPPSKSSGVM